MNLMINESGNWQENEDGTWSEAVPLPFYGLRKHCPSCREKFWRESSYVRHYQQKHTDGVRYKRTPTDMIALGRKLA